MERWLQRQWQKIGIWHLLLIPLSWLFGLLVWVRKRLYQLGCLSVCRLPVPVIVVGNLTVGGSGKTPLVIWLVQQLQTAGFKPGVISRGYGGDARVPTAVTVDAKPEHVGDEPVLIVKRTGCPVWVSSKRAKAGKALLEAHPECDVIVSDDGMQHYGLYRDLEIAIFDSEKSVGNGFLLPAGPLREPLSRLRNVNAIVCNGRKHIDNAFQMRLQAGEFVNLLTNEVRSVSEFKDKKLYAIAGIGNPDRFFSTLSQMGMAFESAVFDDHHLYEPEDLAYIQADDLVMTEKDAVKCKAFAKENYWYLPVTAQLETGLMDIVITRLRNP